ncbi:MAG: hypothetical protein U1E56_08940 [Bauldia sp.]
MSGFVTGGATSLYLFFVGPLDELGQYATDGIQTRLVLAGALTAFFSVGSALSGIVFRAL